MVVRVVICVLGCSLLGTVLSVPVELELSAKSDRSGRHNDDEGHTHKPATEEDLKLSVDEIAAQLINDPPVESVAGNSPPTGIEAITEGQAKVVVDHIKGLLSDIYTNSLVDETITEEGEYASDLGETTTTHEPTILEVFSHLEQNSVHDKESLLSIIQEFTTRASQADVKTGESDENSTPSIFVLEQSDNKIAISQQDLVRATTTTTTTTTQSTTTTTTTTTTTRPTPQPTPPGVMKIIDQSFGGVFSGLGNMASVLFTGRPLFGEGQQQQPANNWFPFGRKKRDLRDEEGQSQDLSGKQIFNKFREELF